MNRIFGQVFGISLLAGLLSLGLAHAALAQATDPLAAAGTYVNAPHNWQMWFPASGSPMQDQIDWLMKYVLWIMTAVVAFVGALMVYVFVKFNATANKTPSHMTHNTFIEVIWIVIPTILLAVIIVPSISLIYYEGDTSNPYMTVTVTGHQWYWEYNYDAVPGLDYTSYMIPDDKLQPGDIRRLSVDHPLVLPINEKIKFNITSSDVLHGFYLPSLGVQKYAIPGTIQTSWTLIPKVGTYFGQCNQICGINHDAMPIEIKAVSMDDYLAWIKVAQANYVMNSYQANPVSSPAPKNEFADLAVSGMTGPLN
jgi:cytochrome c oxidase subunit 2